MDLRRTLDFVKDAHDGLTDKRGEPYWQHADRVMRRLGAYAPLEIKMVALLHDAIEDTHVDADDLRFAGFPLGVIESVALLTRDHRKTYAEYIQAIAQSGNFDAVRVKLADLADNLDPARSDGLTPSLARRYETAQIVLQDALLGMLR